MGHQFDHNEINNLSKLGADLKSAAAARKLEEPNPFPIEAFPISVQDIIRETHKTSKFPPAYTGSAMLVAAATAIGNSCEVDINGFYKGIASLFVLGVGNSSTTKSSPFEYVFDPLMRRDIRNHAEYDRRERERDAIVNMPERERVSRGIEIPPQPTINKCLIDDYTPEVVLMIMKFNPRGLCAYNDEFAENLQNKNRYNKGGAESKEIKMLDGRPCGNDRVDPKKRVLIAKPCYNIAGTIQVGLLRNELAGGNRNISGYIFRAIIAYPEVGDKEHKTAEKEPRLNPVYLERWSAIIDVLFGLPLHLDENNTPVPKPIPLSQEACDIHREWFNKNVDFSNDSDSDNIKSICGKFEIIIYRIALVIQLLNYACREGAHDIIEGKSMRSAAMLIEYYRHTALRVQNIITDANPLDILPLKKRQFYASLPDSFTKGEADKIAADSVMKGKKPDAIKKWVHRFLNDKKLFTAVGGGTYQKVLTEEKLAA